MKLLCTVALFCAAVLCAAASQSPQPSPPQSAPSPQPPREPSSSQPTFRTRAAGVRIDVLVTDNERPVPGLTAKDFALTDSGVPQDIEVSTTLSDLPVDVVIVLDTSSSLREEGLRHLVRATDTLLASLQPRDRAALVTFSQVVVIRAALTPEHTRVRAIVRDLKNRGDDVRHRCRVCRDDAAGRGSFVAAARVQRRRR